MAQVIVTKYFGATDHHGSRVKAKSQAGSVTVPWDHALDVRENHAVAARGLCRKLDWKGLWLGGALPDDTGYAFVKSKESYPLSLRMV